MSCLVAVAKQRSKTAQTHLKVFRRWFVRRHSLPQTWNVRFRISAEPRTDMRSGLQHNPRNCSDGPALTQWAWQITMRSILARSHCTIPQRSYFEKKLSQSELKHQPGRLAIRV